MRREPVFKTKPMQQVEHRLGRPIEDVIRELYHDEGLTQAQVADRLGVNDATITRWMRDLGIETRFPGPRSKAAA